MTDVYDSSGSKIGTLDTESDGFDPEGFGILGGVVFLTPTLIGAIYYYLTNGSLYDYSSDGLDYSTRHVWLTLAGVSLGLFSLTIESSSYPRLLRIMAALLTASTVYGFFHYFSVDQHMIRARTERCGSGLPLSEWEPLPSACRPPQVAIVRATSPTLVPASGADTASERPAAVPTLPAIGVGPSPRDQSGARETVLVGNTDGIGVFVRARPIMDAKIRAWPEGTVLDVVGPDVEVEGERWKHVRDPAGNDAWVPARYTVAGAPETSSPPPR